MIEVESLLSVKVLIDYSHKNLRVEYTAAYRAKNDEYMKTIIIALFQKVRIQEELLDKIERIFSAHEKKNTKE